MNGYNGWTNYETWRANLEFVDGMVAWDIIPDFSADTTIDEVAEVLKGWVAELLFDGQGVSPESFAGSLLDRFLYQVDWIQIAEHIVYDARAELGYSTAP